MRARLGLLALLVVTSLVLTGCTSTLTGAVVSATTGNPIAGAKVTIGDQVVVTDANGEFAFDQLNRGTLTGSVEVTGFPAVQFTHNVGKDNQSVVVEVDDAIVRLDITELAVEPAPVTALVAASLNGIEATGSPLTFPPVPPGEYILVVSADKHETYETTLTVEVGEVDVAVTLSLTPLATYERFLEAGKYSRDDVSYLYIHPDERELLSLEDWKAAGQGTAMKSVTLGGMRMLETWKSLFTNKTYEDVAQIDRSIEYQVTDPQYSDFGMTFTDNHSQHWVMLDGIWYLVHREPFE